MAGYQRHKFDTTYVQPQSDGGWGALARGFSNGYSIGKAISGAVNQYNVSSANQDYDKAIDAARQQTLQTEASANAANADDVMGGLQGKDPSDVPAQKAQPERAIKMTEDQLNKLSPEGKKYFEDYYAKQEAAGNKGEYRYDKGTRAAMETDARQKRDKAVRDSYLFWEGDKAYRDYRTEQIDFDNKEAMQGIQDRYNSPDWYAHDGVADRLNNLSTYMGSMLGQNYGKFSVVDGKLYNDVGNGPQEVKGDGLSMLKRLTMTDEIWDKTGNSDAFTAAMNPIAMSEKMGIARDELKLKSAALNMKGAAGDKAPVAMKDSDMIGLLKEGWKPQVDANGNEFMVNPEGNIFLPTRRRFGVNKLSQTNHATGSKPEPKKSKKQAVPTEDKPKKQAIPTREGKSTD